MLGPFFNLLQSVPSLNKYKLSPTGCYVYSNLFFMFPLQVFLMGTFIKPKPTLVKRNEGLLTNGLFYNATID